ncbi:hypothetical protein ACQ4PT_035225 [Festuca glaucescens]
MAAASVGATNSRAVQPHHNPSPEPSSQASSSSPSFSSRAAEAEAWPVSCDGGAEEDVLHLDSLWVAAAEAESRLEEAAMAAAAAGLRLCAENEAEADEIRDNLQRQDDELMALEAIYRDDLAVLENKGALRHFQIYIRYELHDGAEVCARFSPLNRIGEDRGCPDDDCIEQHEEDERDDFSYSCNFEHLPPLILTCLLPQSYPSKEPPYFTVTAKWMNGPNVSQLCEMLDTIWAELPGEEVVYRWVEWIHSSSLPQLGFDNKITLGPDIPSHKGDSRAISRSLSLESVIPSMLSYSSRKCYQVFLEDLHMCMICLNQSKGSNFIKLPGRCDLFHHKEKDTTDWGKLLEQLETRNRVRTEKQPVGSTIKCPKCRRKIYKDDDKYIFCWACQASYCTLCKKQVQFAGVQSEHWGSQDCLKIKF